MMHLIKEYSFVIVEESDKALDIVRWLLARTNAPDVDTSPNSWIHTLTPGSIIILNNVNHSPRFVWGFDLVGGTSQEEDRMRYLLKLMHTGNFTEVEMQEVLARISTKGKENDEEQEVRVREDTVQNIDDN